jgi:hypothetical protein
MTRRCLSNVPRIFQGEQLVTIDFNREIQVVQRNTQMDRCNVGDMGFSSEDIGVKRCFRSRK